MLLRARPWPARRGAATVEMAVVAPVLFMLVLGSIEFGRMMMVTNVVTSAAREGARSGSISGSSNSDVTAAINTALTQYGLDSSKATTTIKVNGTVADVNTAVTGDQITVGVTVTYGDVAWVTPFFLGKTNPLGGMAVMRHE
jgi:Flp pilus assembly protein TadG